MGLKCCVHAQASTLPPRRASTMNATHLANGQGNCNAFFNGPSLVSTFCRSQKFSARSEENSIPFLRFQPPPKSNRPSIRMRPFPQNSQCFPLGMKKDSPVGCVEYAPQVAHVHPKEKMLYENIFRTELPINVVKYSLNVNGFSKRHPCHVSHFLPV